METRPLTVNDYIEIQKRHLAEWKEVLKSEVYDYLEREATKDNHNVRSKSDIVRGCQLSEIVNRYMSNIRNAKIKKEWKLN